MLQPTVAVNNRKTLQILNYSNITSTRRRHRLAGTHQFSQERQQTRAMEDEDPSWFTTMTVLGDNTTPDALLDALLEDVARSNVGRSTPRRLEAARTNGSAWKSSSSSSSMAADDEHPSDAMEPPPPKKRKRTRHYRPKNEIEALRQSVADLESLLALARQCHREGRRPALQAIDCLKEGQYTPQEAMWMGVATRQYKLMRESQVENERLRSQVLSQLQIVKGLTRLVQRAQAGLPSEGVQSAIQDSNTTSFALKRLTLERVVADMHDHIDKAFEDDSFTSKTHELSTSSTYEFKDNIVPPGVMLASGSVRRFTTRPVEELVATFLPYDRPSGPGKDVFRIEYVDEQAEVQAIQGRIHLPMPAVEKCVIIRRARVWDTTRASIVIASSMWPEPSNQSPWTHLGMDTKQWIDIRKLPSPRDGQQLVEVRTRIEAHKLSDSPSVIPLIEARSVQGFVAKTVTFTMDYLHQKLDALLLKLNTTDVI